jgi:selenocysteine-specific elongation factor
MLYTIATAGHIDHGKSTLVRALTGMDPDRLPEEKEREMTIELGFAWFSLPNGSEVAIVDVPGHERFVDAMITGVGSIDMVMFIVAADDGWMPQSQEHLEILDYLDTKRGMIVITKADLVKQDWLELVIDDVKEKVKGTFLDGAPVHTFAANDNSGLDQISQAVETGLSGITSREHPGLPRLYVDRVFSMAGHGAVVTGTMRDGVFSVGDDIRVVPESKSGKIKSMQTHKKARDRSEAVSRVALNISGISHNDLSRGSAVITAGQYAGTKSVAAKLLVSPHAKVKLTHNRIVKLLIGTAKPTAKMFVFKDDTFEPGEDGYCEFHFEQPVLARIGDRFIVRLQTPDVLLGGGVVIDTDCARHSRSDGKIRKHYETRDVDELESLVVSDLKNRKRIAIDDLLYTSNYSGRAVNEAVDAMVGSGVLARHGNALYMTDYVQRVSEKLIDRVLRFHENSPALPGISKAELVSRSGYDAEIAEEILSMLISEGRLETRNAFVHTPGFASKLKPDQQRLRNDILAMFKSDPKNPPLKKQVERMSFAMPDILNFMVSSGELVDLPGGVLLLGDEFERMQARIVERIKSEGKIDVAGVREMFGYSRKYGVPILEKLDSIGLTKRVGDHRVLLDQ